MVRRARDTAARDLPCLQSARDIIANDGLAAYNRPMPYDQIFIGGTTAILCLLGLWNEAWVLSETSKGRRLTGWFGQQRGLWVLRVILCLGLLFGVLLAMGIINPVRWDTTRHRPVHDPSPVASDFMNSLSIAVA
ncbi:MAG: hypothetical protein ACF8TS_04835 [Maioricimonas sp. JB049]